MPPLVSTAKRGYERLYVEHVLQPDQGCDLDFLVDDASAGASANGRTLDAAKEMAP
jgi:hypothetical protein